MKKKIIATLQWGRVFSVFLEILSLAIFLYTAILYILFGIVYPEDFDFQGLGWYGWVGCVLLPICEILGICYFFYKRKKHMEYVNLWMQDAVEIDNAKLNEVTPIKFIAGRRDRAFQITFKYNDKKITILRDTSADFGTKQPRFHHRDDLKYLYRFVGTVKILYSPSNNQVMFYKKSR